MLWEYIPPPNERYESKSLGTWSSTTDVNNFLSAYNHDNNYNGLSLGNYVTIQDGTYNQVWEIAGFDCEHNQTAADGTVYDNGYGILMIPKTQLTTTQWHMNTTVSYRNSAMNTSALPTAANNLKNMLGNHMINRNVLLGSAQNGTSPRNGTTSAYSWTTSYLTLMSVGQMTGTFKQHTNQYDDGEANYKLPLFNYEGFKNGYDFWVRCVWGIVDDTGSFCPWKVNMGGSIWLDSVYGTYGVRPLMLIR